MKKINALFLMFFTGSFISTIILILSVLLYPTNAYLVLSSAFFVVLCYSAEFILAIIIVKEYLKKKKNV